MTNHRLGELLEPVVSQVSRPKPVLHFSRFVDLKRKIEAAAGGRTLVVSSAEDISKTETLIGGRARFLIFTEGLPAEAIASRLPRLRIGDPERLHLSEDTDIPTLARRVISGIAHENGPQRIADAWIEEESDGETLVLLSPGFERLYVLASLLAKFVDPSQISKFEFDEDGSFLYWPEADVHLGWEQFVQLVDPAAAAVAEQKKLEYGRRYGAAIRKLREEQGIRQSDVRGIDPRHLRRVEHGQNIASKATLAALAEAHGLPLDDYLRQVAERITH